MCVLAGKVEGTKVSRKKRLCVLWSESPSDGALVDASKVGQPLTCKVVRGQKTLTLTVVTGDLSSRPMASR